jgi:hypothetical protein
MKLSALQVSLLKEVIEAAKDGRYCHGNGANWVIVDKRDRNTVIHIDHVRSERKVMSATESENYLRGNRPFRDDKTAQSLTDFIKQ